jgi:hypothetical protein
MVLTCYSAYLQTTTVNLQRSALIKYGYQMTVPLAHKLELQHAGNHSFLRFHEDGKFVLNSMKAELTGNDCRSTRQ